MDETYETLKAELGSCPDRDEDLAGYCRWQAALFERLAAKAGTDPALGMQRFADRLRRRATERPALLCRN